MGYTEAYKWLRAHGVEPAEARAALDAAAEGGRAAAWYGERDSLGRRRGWRVIWAEAPGYSIAGPVPA